MPHPPPQPTQSPLPYRQCGPGTKLYCPAALQIELLKRLDWRMTLDAQLEVAPCRDILFGPKYETWQRLPEVSACQAHTSYAHHMRALVGCIQKHAAVLVQSRISAA